MFGWPFIILNFQVMVYVGIRWDKCVLLFVLGGPSHNLTGLHSPIAPQVNKVRQSLAMESDQVRVQCDASSLRSFVTYAIKRHNGSRRRVSCSNSTLKKFGIASIFPRPLQTL